MSLCSSETIYTVCLLKNDQLDDMNAVHNDKYNFQATKICYKLLYDLFLLNTNCN